MYTDIYMHAMYIFMYIFICMPLTLKFQYFKKM